MKRSENWYELAPEGVAKNEELKILWDAIIQYKRDIRVRKSDIIVMNKNERSCAIIAITIPEDKKTSKNEKGKIERY